VQERVELGKTLYEVAPALTELVKLWDSDPWSKPRTDLQKRALSTLNRLQMISKHMRGSAGYKQTRRNEIRGLIRKFSTPALFITINPSDVCNPLVSLIEGVDVADWCSMSAFDRAVFVARHPSAAAQFFNGIVNGFLQTIVKGGSLTASIFGICEAYYGMVEAQGKGTLHGHFML
jgi:hypothetical protein